ncbi:MAG TPA: ABC transporter ATP-binding protein, partial [Actinomycetota bacterium]|nr:ABC transporter ATP-binding protein [Actinomycetota bacterium]
MPQSAATGALAVEGLRKAFGDALVLDQAGLRAPAGRVVALLGPSGCGKTTLLRCIAGLERPDAGQVRLDGRDLSAPGAFVAPERRRIGMVFQDGALFPHLTVAGNVGYGLSRSERRGARVAEALALVDLAGFGDRLPASLSGGQAQRVALARALVTRPSVLLLDEPFSNLDTILRVQIRAEVQRLLADLGVTAVFVTHDQEEAFVVGDEVAVMLAGTIVQQAAPAELYRAPASRAVAGFLGDANLLPGVAAAGLADTAIGRVPLRAELRGDVDVLLRPEQLRVSA